MKGEIPGLLLDGFSRATVSIWLGAFDIQEVFEHTERAFQVGKIQGRDRAAVEAHLEVKYELFLHFFTCLGQK